MNRQQESAFHSAVNHLKRIGTELYDTFSAEQTLDYSRPELDSIITALCDAVDALADYDPSEDGTSGQDRKSYSDEQDRDSYTVPPNIGPFIITGFALRTGDSMYTPDQLTAARHKLSLVTFNLAKLTDVLDIDLNTFDPPETGVSLYEDLFVALEKIADGIDSLDHTLNNDIPNGDYDPSEED